MRTVLVGTPTRISTVLVGTPPARTPTSVNTVLSGRPPRRLPPTGGSNLPGGEQPWLVTIISLAAGVLIVVALRETVFRRDD